MRITDDTNGSGEDAASSSRRAEGDASSLQEKLCRSMLMATWLGDIIRTVKHSFLTLKMLVRNVILKKFSRGKNFSETPSHLHFWKEESPKPGLNPGIEISNARNLQKMSTLNFHTPKYI